MNQVGLIIRPMIIFHAFLDKKEAPICYLLIILLDIDTALSYKDISLIKKIIEELNFDDTRRK